MQTRCVLIKLLLLLVFFTITNISYAQNSNESLESILVEFGNHYHDISNDDKKKLSQFLSNVEMIDPEFEISNIIDYVGPNFYKLNEDSLISMLDLYMRNLIRPEAKSYAFYQEIIDEFNLIDSNRQISNLIEMAWSSYIYYPEKVHGDKILVFNNQKEIYKELNEASQRQSYYLKNGPEDSLLKNILTLKRIEDQADLFILTLYHNNSDEKRSLYAIYELAIDSLNNVIVQSDELSAEQKAGYLFAVNKQVAFSSVDHGRNSELILPNNVRIKNIFSSPDLFISEDTPDSKIAQRLKILKYFEAQIYFQFAREKLNIRTYKELGRNVLSEIITNHNTSSLSGLYDYLLLLDYNVLRLQRLLVLPGQIYIEEGDLDLAFPSTSEENNHARDKFKTSCYIGALWSIFQSHKSLKKYSDLTDFEEDFNFKAANSKFFSHIIQYLTSVGDFDAAGYAVLRALQKRNCTVNFFQNHFKCVTEMYERQGHVEAFQWCLERTPRKHMFQFGLTNKPKGYDLAYKINSFYKMTDKEKEYFLSWDFQNEVRSTINGYYNANIYNRHAVIVISRLAFENKRFDLANHLNLIFESHNNEVTSAWSNAKYSINKAALLEKELSIKNEQLRKNKLRQLSEELEGSNTNLLILIVFIAFITLISILLARRTAIANRFIKKQKEEVEMEKTNSDLLRLSIGQIGHLAKNTISEINETHFLTQTSNEIKNGKVALKRTGRIFQMFEENSNKTTQTVLEEVMFASQLILAQNRYYSDGKTKDDFLSHIEIIKGTLDTKSQRVPIYILVNIIDNAFKYADLTKDLKVQISAHLGKTGKLIRVETTAELNTNANSTGKGSKYIESLLRLHNGWKSNNQNQRKTAKGYIHEFYLLNK